MTQRERIDSILRHAIKKDVILEMLKMDLANQGVIIKTDKPPYQVMSFEPLIKED